MQLKWKKNENEPSHSNVTPFDNEFFQEQNKKQKRTLELRKYVHRRMSVILIAGALVIVPLCGNLIENVSEIRGLDGKISEIKNEQKIVQGKNKDLKVEVGLLQDDEYLAKLARSRYYLSKDGEIVFSLPEDNRSKAVAQEAAKNP